MEKEQEVLLIILVEAMRKIPRLERHKFLVSGPSFGRASSTVMHNGLPGKRLEVFGGDMEALASQGLLMTTFSSRGNPIYDISPYGYEYYEHLKKNTTEPVQRIEDSVRTYINSEQFQSRYPRVWDKWIRAEEKLWASDSKQELTNIGHLCREAMQEYASIIAEKHEIAEEVRELDCGKTVARIRAVLAKQVASLGSSEKVFLEALLTYWGTVSDLAQRQEHGAQKEGRELTWGDARRLVFQTIIVMYEIDGAI